MVGRSISVAEVAVASMSLPSQRAATFENQGRACGELTVLVEATAGPADAGAQCV